MLAKFQPGALVATAEVLKHIDHNYLMAALCQHLQGQWGLLDVEDWDANERALKDGGRLLSVYPLPNSPKSFWIISEADRSSTTILLPGDY